MSANDNTRAPCRIWTGSVDANGYPVGRLHRRAWEIANGRQLASGEVVRHACDVRACIEPSHLLVGTHADNRRDCVERGRQAKGEVNGRAILTEHDVRDIRASKLTSATLARCYGVDRTTIKAIRLRKTWRHVG